MGYNLLQIVGFFGFFGVGIMWVCSFINFYYWHVCLILILSFNYFMDMCYLCSFAIIILDAFRKIPIVFSILLIRLLETNQLIKFLVLNE